MKAKREIRKYIKVLALPTILVLPFITTNCSRSKDNLSIISQIRKDLLKFKDFNFDNSSYSDIINAIDYQWLELNSRIIFENYEEFENFKITNLNVKMPTENRIEIFYNENSETKVIKIFKTVDGLYGEINLGLIDEQSSDITSFHNSEIKITNNNISRNINNNYYSTNLLNEYRRYGFKYPSYNFNYEKENTIFRISNGTSLDMSELVFNELNSEGKKYSDAQWIKNEINNKRLKKHPAADGMHEQKLSNNQKAVDKFFSLPSTLLGNTSLGLYAPAGEVCKITFSDETYELMKSQNINNFQIVINQSYWDNREKPDSGQISNRYPFVRTEFTVKLSDINEVTKSFEFGTPFGGTISIFINKQLKSNFYNDLYPSYSNYVFNVSGAVEMLSYFHGVTTEDEWNDQIARLKNGKLTTPEMSFDFQYGSGNIQFTGKNQIAWINLEEVEFPKKIIDKWNNFLFVSEYFSSKDIKNDVRKISFNFNDDIWGGAGAWGGGNALYCPLSWAKSFLQNKEFTIVSDWGNFHEINHNFQQDAAFFMKRSHGETNQVTIANLALISNTSRWRNLINTTSEYTKGGWTRLSNSYSVIEYIKESNYNQSNASDFEYQIYGLFLYSLLGAYRYIDYVRNDIATDNGNYQNNNGKSIQKEGGFYEILELSNYFKLDFWPALKNYRSIWYDDNADWSDDHKWPSSYESATDFQKSEIDNLRSKYKSFDFLGNIYASGTYIYDNDSSNFIYTEDTQAPYQIPAGKPYVFDFEKGINWLENNENYRFSWSSLEFERRTKLGGTLEFDSSSSKKLVYTPPNNSLDKVDEFDISIIPDDFLGKPSNYIPKYKWKIKVRQEMKSPIFKTYTGWNENYNFQQMINDMIRLNNGDEPQYWNNLKEEYTEIHNFDLNNGILFDKKNGKYQGVSSHFVFVAPKDGNYEFEIKYKKDIMVFANNEKIYERKGNGNNWVKIGRNFNLKKGEQLKFDTYIITDNNTEPVFNIRSFLNDKKINMINNVMVPYINDLSNDPESLLYDPKYNYHERKIDYNQIQTSMTGLNVSREIDYINKDIYNFTTNDPNITGNNRNTIDERLKNYDNSWLEIWQHRISLEVEFDYKVNIKNIFFYHRTDNHPNGRPTQMIIKNENDQILFNGKYGAQKNDRSNFFSHFWFDNVCEVKKLKFEFYNENLNAVILNSIQFSSDTILKPNKILSILNPSITPYGSWEYINNDSLENISNVNRTSLKSTKKDDVLTLDMFASGFDLIGQKDINNSDFEIWINDQLIETVSCYSEVKEENKILFSYTSNNAQGEHLSIRIVNKSNKKLYLNYFQTYGDKVILY